MMSPHVKDTLALGLASQPLLAFPLSHIAGSNGFQGKTLFESGDHSRNHQYEEMQKIPRSLLPSQRDVEQSDRVTKLTVRCLNITAWEVNSVVGPYL